MTKHLTTYTLSVRKPYRLHRELIRIRGINERTVRQEALGLGWLVCAIRREASGALAESRGSVGNILDFTA